MECFKCGWVGKKTLLIDGCCPICNNKSFVKKKNFKEDIRVLIDTFVIPGLGEKGEDCGAERGRKMSPSGDAIMFQRLSCKRVECPVCWTDWMHKRVFDMVMRLVATIMLRGELPYYAVLSVPPDVVCGGWSWRDINTSLFRRGYRRSKDVGVDCGYGIFHPYRIKKDIKKRLWDAGYGRPGKDMDAALWKGVRENALSLDSWMCYVDVSPHVHAIVFGTPKEHKCKDYFIGFMDNKFGVPLEQDISSIIGYSIYLLSHAGIMREKISNVTRLWGNVAPGMGFRDVHAGEWVKKTKRSDGKYDSVVMDGLLPSDVYAEVAVMVAEALGMSWNVEDGLCYRDDDVLDDRVWEPISFLFTCMYNDDWLAHLSESQLRFWKAFFGYYVSNNGQVPLFGQFGVPKDIVVVRSGIGL